jgi:ferrous iron transport protein B
MIDRKKSKNEHKKFNQTKTHDQNSIKKLTIALAGNPNVGKTTLFNAITGANQHVGNWPGVTVEKKVGYRKFKGYELEVVDLPGTYSLTAYSIDEVVTRNFIVDQRPDVVINIVDVTNLERNLYLTTQLMELEVKLVMSLNMFDLMSARGDVLDSEKLAKFLEIPIVKTVGNTGMGVDRLLSEVIRESKLGAHHEHAIGYGKELERNIISLEDILREYPELIGNYPIRWFSIKLLENDPEIIKKLKKWPDVPKQKVMNYLKNIQIQQLEIDFVDKRYENINSILNQVLKKKDVKITPSDMVDRVLTHKYLGIPIFLALMWGVFELTFTIAQPFMDVIDLGFVNLSEYIFENIQPEWLASLLGRGIIGGVGFILVFLPTIFILFFILSFLEDSGYMARAAFIMDKLMYNIGLQGKSFIPLLLGFGCTVPAIMATRTIEDKNDRLITILVNPFISCGARLPVYILLAGTFFGRQAGTIIFIIYALSILFVIISAKLLRSTIIKGSPAPFIMELPPYHLPTVKSSAIHMWERGSLYLRKAGTVILGAAIIIWVISSFNNSGYISESTKEIDDTILIAEGIIEGSGTFQGEGQFSGIILENITLRNGTKIYKGEHVNELLINGEDSVNGIGSMDGSIKFEGNGTYIGSEFVIEDSYSAYIGKSIEPITEPLGFNWKINTALIFGFAAKEFVIGTLGILYGVGESGTSGNFGNNNDSIAYDQDNDNSANDNDLTNALNQSPDFSPLLAFCIMLFVLIYTPCIATVAVIKKETGSWRWPAFSMIYSTALAWLAVFLVYNVGLALGY